MVSYTHPDRIKNVNFLWLFWKVYHRSSLLKNYFVSCDVGVIDSNFRGTKAGQIILQIAFHKKEEIVFKKVDCLSSTERRAGGFGSTFF